MRRVLTRALPCAMTETEAAFRFSHLLTVADEDIDELGHANNVQYLRWVQDVAGAHWRAIVPAEALGRYIWVVREHHIRYLQSAVAGDVLRATTWVGEMRGAQCQRFTRLEREADSVLLSEAETQWVLLDPQSRRPVRVGEEVAGWLVRTTTSG